MNIQERLDLEEMRKAAQNREQEQLQFLLKRLLQGLDYYLALAIPLQRIQTFLPKFENHYPEETWVRQLLLMINSYGKAPDNEISAMALDQSFSEAGMGNFLKAVYDLVQAMQEKHTSEVRIGFMASSVVNIIMAELAAAWYGTREKAWQLVRANDVQAQKIAYVFWTDTQTAKLDSRAWLEIADSIEASILRMRGSA